MNYLSQLLGCYRTFQSDYIKKVNAFYLYQKNVLPTVTAVKLRAFVGHASLIHVIFLLVNISSIIFLRHKTNAGTPNDFNHIIIWTVGLYEFLQYSWLFPLILKEKFIFIIKKITYRKVIEHIFYFQFSSKRIYSFKFSKYERVLEKINLIIT